MWPFKSLSEEANTILKLCHENKERIIHVNEGRYVLNVNGICILAYRRIKPTISLNDWNCGLPSHDQNVIYKYIMKYAIENHKRDMEYIKTEQLENTRRLLSK